MNKSYLTLGLMSGTSGDGVDASIIRSNGIDNYESISDQYFEYDKDIYKDFHNLKEKINSLKDLDKFSSVIEPINITDKVILSMIQQFIKIFTH